MDISSKSGPCARAIILSRDKEHIKEEHSHPEGELVLNLKGNINCTVNNTLWVIPQHCAFFIPGNKPHQVKTAAHTDYCLAFVNPIIDGLPEKCGFLTLSPLLREMILHMATMPENYYENDHDLHFANVMINTLIKMPVASYSMSIPYSPKLKEIADVLSSDPSDRRTVAEWAKTMGMSERTLARLVINETGLTFGQWRQQFQLFAALRKLETGSSIQQTAWDLGYESVTAFITMFKKHFGKPPRKYLAEHEDEILYPSFHGI
ncbi:AraC family transcriptional regulator [Seleniivibrio woodruffii]|uniref:AraC family transcriptional regulator n=1 Tax=Seleniivibrio woodruffii TaxID=1078050 RepID=UPI002409A09B|nr:AraC family transcriptional regulator [Seleniivibrio woodruffii]